MMKDAIDKLLVFCIFMIGVGMLGHMPHQVDKAPDAPLVVENIIEVPNMVIVSDFTCRAEEDE